MTSTTGSMRKQYEDNFKTATVRLSTAAYTSHFHCGPQHNTSYVKKLIEDNSNG